MAADSGQPGSNQVSGQFDHPAKVVYLGTIKERPTIELRNLPGGRNEAFLVPSGAEPIPTGVSLQESASGYRVYCRIRKRWLAFKPEEVVRQMIRNRLIDVVR